MNRLIDFLRICRTLPVIVFSIYVGSLDAAVITRIASDDESWMNASGWDCNCIPTAVDDVIIEGLLVTLDAAAEVNSLTLRSKDNLNDTYLLVTTGGYLEVQNDVFMTVVNPFYSDVIFEITLTGAVDVNGNFIHERPLDSNGYGELALNVNGQGSLSVLGNLEFNHLNGFNDEPDAELTLNDDAVINVWGNFIAHLTNGSDLNFNLLGNSRLSIFQTMTMTNESFGFLDMILEDLAQLEVTQDLIIQNQGAESSARSTLVINDAASVFIQDNLDLRTDGDFDKVSIRVYDSGMLHVDQDLKFENVVSNALNVEFYSNTEFQIGGNVDRTNGTGKLQMEDNSAMSFMGDQQQTIPTPYIGDDDFGGDLITLNNVNVMNAAGVMIEQVTNAETSVGMINLSSGRLFIPGDQSLKITNPNPDAISTDDGGIVFMNEDEPSMAKEDVDQRSADDPFGSSLIWETGTSVGTYEIPLETSDGSPIPVLIQITEALGQVSVSTYATETTNVPNNRPLPNEVSSFMIEGQEGAGFTVDRFWKVETENTPTNNLDIQFSYTDGELLNNPDLDETNMKVYAYQSGDDSWSEVVNSSVDESLNEGYATVSASENILVIATPQTIVPVKWLSFEARQENGDVMLRWSTAVEINSSHFQVERSMDGHNWEVLGSLVSNNSNYDQSDYVFLDRTASSGYNYYRIKQVDQDGRFEYSIVRSVLLNERGVDFSILPNPGKISDGVLSIYLHTTIASAKINVFDEYGRLMYERLLHEDDQYLELDLHSYSPGMYFVQVINGGSNSINPVVLYE